MSPSPATGTPPTVYAIFVLYHKFGDNGREEFRGNRRGKFGYFDGAGRRKTTARASEDEEQSERDKGFLVGAFPVEQEQQQQNQHIARVDVVHMRQAQEMPYEAA